MPAEWITAAEAAQRLGVKQASLYSYVSRGVLMRRRAEGSRASLFNASEVEGLARRGRPRRAPGPAELVIETELTEITGEHLRYRGLDAVELARERSFEEVAGLLWAGSLDGEPPGSWEATEAAVATHFEMPRTLVRFWASSCASILSTPGDKRPLVATCSSYLFYSTKT